MHNRVRRPKGATLARHVTFHRARKRHYWHPVSMADQLPSFNLALQKTLDKQKFTTNISNVTLV